jgi:Transglutaminase-like superfamily
VNGPHGWERVTRLAKAAALCPLAVVWTELSLRGLQRDLADRRIAATVPPSYLVSPLATVAARAWLRVRRASCLQRSLIVQRWLFAAGESHDVLVGVASRSPIVATGSPILAHAWLDHEAAPGYKVIARLNPLRTGAPRSLG